MAMKVQRQLRRHAQAAQRRVLEPLYSIGSRVECPLCAWTGGRFLPVNGVPARRCPSCGSLQRYRMLFLFLQRRTTVFTEPTRLLEIAPSGPVVPLVRRAPTVTYVGLDLSDRTGITMRGDITRMGLADHSFDAGICFHVLEHIPDDDAAMAELRRILKPGGQLVVQVPLNEDGATEQDPGASADERTRRFGQEDHVRLYGWDVVDRLEAAGFTVERHEPIDYLSAEEVERFGLAGDDRWILTATA